MTFQNLRVGNKLYIVHKDEKAYVEIAQVTEPASAPMPKYKFAGTTTYTPGASQEMVVSVKAKLGEVVYDYQQLPPSLDLVDLGNNTICTCSKEAAIDTLANFKQTSIDALAMQEYHTNVVASCDEAILALSPEIAERQRQEADTKALREELAELKSMVSELTKQLK